MERVLVLGKNGQLGGEFERIIGKHSRYSAYFLSRSECDISDLKNVFDAFDHLKPDIVINCAAYNLVDKAEENPYEAMRVNYLGVYNLAVACDRWGAFLVHYSTDYVFDGAKGELYREEDEPNPLNAYAKSKLYGERAVEECLDRYLIFRTSWVYGCGRQNFLNKLEQWAQTQDRLRVACDEFSVPTSTRTIAEITLKALENELTGMYHLVNSGYTSRFEWAKKYFEIRGIGIPVYPAYRADFNLPAKRPGFSAMSNEKLARELGIEIRNWDDELHDFFLIFSGC